MKRIGITRLTRPSGPDLKMIGGNQTISIEGASWLQEEDGPRCGVQYNASLGLTCVEIYPPSDRLSRLSNEGVLLPLDRKKNFVFFLMQSNQELPTALKPQWRKGVVLAMDCSVVDHWPVCNMVQILALDTALGPRLSLADFFLHESLRTGPTQWFFDDDQEALFTFRARDTAFVPSYIRNYSKSEKSRSIYFSFHRLATDVYFQVAQPDNEALNTKEEDDPFEASVSDRTTADTKTPEIVITEP